MGCVFFFLFFFFFFFLIEFFTTSIAAPPIVSCTSSICSLHNSYGPWPDRQPCFASAVSYPATESELLQAVASAVKLKQSIKVVTNTGHSIPRWACPRGRAGLLISTRNYTSNVVVDKEKMTATVDSGVELGELVNVLGKEGMVLVHTPYWSGVTIGGLLSTGCHGSSLFGKGSAVHEYVVGMRLVIPASSQDGFAKIITLSAHDERLNAAKVSLGILGVISQITLALEPQFKRSMTRQFKADDDLENQIVAFGKAHEFGDLAWFPAQRKVMLTIGDRVPIETEGDGLNDFLGFQPAPSSVLKLVRAAEEASEAISSRTVKCLASAVQVSVVFGRGAGFKNNNRTFKQYPIIGFQNRMQTSGRCHSSTDPGWVCPWDSGIRGFFYHETTIAIPLDKIKGLIHDVKRLRDMDPSSLCGVEQYVGFLMRFVKGSSAYLGHQVDSVDIDIAYYRAASGEIPRLNQDVLEEIEQMAILKYGGLPHWGKNRPLVFDGVAKKYPKIAQFHAIREELDPEGIFSSEWSDAVLGIKGNVTSEADHCALEGLCICSEDRHCAVERGYLCRPGKVFKEARVCRLEKSSNWSSSTMAILLAMHPLRTHFNSWLQRFAAAITRLLMSLKAWISCIVPPVLF